MKRFKKLSAIVSVMLIFILALTGCTQSKPKELTKIKLAEVTHSIFYAPQYVAISQGFFEEEGLDVELINTQGADKTMAALLSGEVDVGFMGPEASVYVSTKDSDNYAINFAQLTQRDGSFLVGREADDKFSFDSLKGKTILGGRAGGMPEMALEYVIKNNGLKIGENTAAGEVNVRTDVQFGVLAGAFTAGEGDYVSLFEPVATQVEKLGQGHVVLSIGSESGDLPYTAYSATKSYMEENPQVIQGFTNAIYKGQLWVQSHSSQEIAKAVQPFFTDLSEEDLVTIVDRYKSIDAFAQTPVMTKDSLEHLMDIIELAGQLEERADYDKIVTTKFADEAVKNIDKDMFNK
jgi:NitT/TauT family transport system substrate-binding protein